MNYFTQNCQNHSKGKNNFNKHCAKEKAIFYFNWLTNERGIDEGGSTLVTEFNNLRLDYGDGNLSLSISKDETIKTGNQLLQRKVKLLLTEDEIRSFTHLVYYIEPFFQWRKQNVKNSTQSLSSESLTDVETPGWWRNWQKRSFTAKRDSALGEGRKSTQNFSLWHNWATSGVLYGSNERLSNWVQLLWIVLYRATFFSKHFLRKFILSRDGGINSWSSWRCCRRKFFFKKSSSKSSWKFVIKQRCHGQKLYFSFKCLLFYYWYHFVLLN